MNRILTIVDKEWAEVFKNQLVLFSMLFPPLIFTILPLVILSQIGHSAGRGANLPPNFVATCGSLSTPVCLQIFTVNEFLLFYMLMPVIIPNIIAAYSIIGEKTTHSLEPLLATPISTSELLTGKSLAAVIPAVLVTWFSFVIFISVLPLVGVGQAVLVYVTSPTWLLAILLAGPFMAILSVNFALLISSRVNDPRAAQQISVVLILPLLLVLFGQIAGFVVLNPTNMLLFILALAIIDVALIFTGARLFQREIILTRWK
ncbi:MAG: ABC transporter permease subunit [Anaerolineaceae bacterium]|nr:ABC transporter permease subunit [Anaerolineaceae bacterium]